MTLLAIVVQHCWQPGQVIQVRVGALLPALSMVPTVRCEMRDTVSLFCICLCLQAEHGGRTFTMSVPAGVPPGQAFHFDTEASALPGTGSGTPSAPPHFSSSSNTCLPALPPGWKMMRTPGGKPYFTNLQAKSTQWEPPPVSSRSAGTSSP